MFLLPTFEHFFNSRLIFFKILWENTNCIFIINLFAYFLSFTREKLHVICEWIFLRISKIFSNWKHWIRGVFGYITELISWGSSEICKSKHVSQKEVVVKYYCQLVHLLFTDTNWLFVLIDWNVKIANIMWYLFVTFIVL